MSQAAGEALQRAGVTGDEIDVMVPHQANLRIVEATAKYAGIPMEKVYVNLDRYGNMSSASIPVALDEAPGGWNDSAGDEGLIGDVWGGIDLGSNGLAVLAGHAGHPRGRRWAALGVAVLRLRLPA